MNIFVLSPGQDTGGQGGRIKTAFDRHAPGWAVRAMRGKNNYLAYPRDLEWDEAKALELYEWADVVHHKNALTAYARLDRNLCKPTVIHHHGTRLRDNAEAVWREAESIGAVQVTSTVDLLESAPGAEWLPAPFDLEALGQYRNPKRGSTVRIAHAPTNRRIKSTARVLNVLDSLSRRYDIEFDLIENYPWKVCLARKGRAHIFIDQLVLGYGNNAIEAWAMGIPVIAGVASPTVRARMVDTWGELPFYEATAKTLEARLAELIESEELRDEWGARGQAHAERWHEEGRVVEQLKDIYRSAPPSKGVKAFRPYEPKR